MHHALRDQYPRNAREQRSKHEQVPDQARSADGTVGLVRLKYDEYRADRRHNYHRPSYAVQPLVGEDDGRYRERQRKSAHHERRVRGSRACEPLELHQELDRYVEGGRYEKEQKVGRTWQAANQERDGQQAKASEREAV